MAVINQPYGGGEALSSNDASQPVSASIVQYTKAYGGTTDVSRYTGSVVDAGGTATEGASVSIGCYAKAR